MDYCVGGFLEFLRVQLGLFFGFWLFSYEGFEFLVVFVLGFCLVQVLLKFSDIFFLILILFQWVFGVIMWEIMIRGQTLYVGIENVEIYNYFIGGNRLKQFSDCLEDV